MRYIEHKLPFVFKHYLEVSIRGRRAEWRENICDLYNWGSRYTDSYNISDDSRKIHVHVFVSWRALCSLQFKLESGLFVKNEQTRVTDKLVLSLQGRRVCICQAPDEVGKYGPTRHVNHFAANAIDLAEFYDHQRALGAPHSPHSPQASDEMSSVAGRVKDRKRRRDVDKTYCKE